MRTFRHKVAATNPNVSASALPRQVTWGRLRVAAGNRGHHRGCVVQSPRRLVAEPRVRHAANEKGCRTLMVSRLRRNSFSSRSSGSPVVRLPQPPVMAKHKDSRKAGRLDNQKKRHRHGHNNFGVNDTSGSGTRSSGAAFFSTFPPVACAVLSALVIRRAEGGHLNPSLGQRPRNANRIPNQALKARFTTE